MLISRMFSGSEHITSCVTPRLATQAAFQMWGTPAGEPFARQALVALSTGSFAKGVIVSFVNFPARNTPSKQCPTAADIQAQGTQHVGSSALFFEYILVAGELGLTGTRVGTYSHHNALRQNARTKEDSWPNNTVHGRDTIRIMFMFMMVRMMMMRRRRRISMRESSGCKLLLGNRITYSLFELSEDARKMHVPLLRWGYAHFRHHWNLLMPRFI